MPREVAHSDNTVEEGQVLTTIFDMGEAEIDWNGAMWIFCFGQSGWA